MIIWSLSYELEDISRTQLVEGNLLSKRNGAKFLAHLSIIKTKTTTTVWIYIILFNYSKIILNYYHDH